jgi:hypothetical protein
MSFLGGRRRIVIAVLAVVAAVAGVLVVRWVTAPDVAAAVAPDCEGSDRKVDRPFPSDTQLTEQWEVPSPRDDVTYDLTGVTSTAYPATRSVFEIGSDEPKLRTCVIGGTVLGKAEDDKTWDYYHDDWNAGCVKILALEWSQVRDLRCDGVEDGIVVKETADNANNTNIYVSGTYLSGIRDDCMENDYTVGGLLQDNLWEGCHTGISERPWGGREWSSPSDEVLTLDHMLIGLYKTPKEHDGKVVMGHNSIFKWSDSGNHVVIRCSVFKVEAKSINGADSMAMPPGTVVDDSECKDNPSTIVWLGRGDYPGETAGMRVVKDEGVWTDAVRDWKSAHGH